MRGFCPLHKIKIIERKRLIIMTRKEKSLCVGILVMIVNFVLSWLLVCGIVKIVTVCCGLCFNWMVASCVWLGIRILGIILKRRK